VAYQVKVGSQVRKAMARLPVKARARILAALRKLAEEPRPVGCQPVKMALKGTYRLRVGNYRVIYTVRDEERLVIVARVTKRGNILTKG